MKANNMIDYKAYSDTNPNIQEKTFFKKGYYSISIRESAFIGCLNGGISGAIAAVLATYGYIALPGFGPIIAMGPSVVLPTSVIIGAIIGSIIGIVIVIVSSFLTD